MLFAIVMCVLLLAGVYRPSGWGMPLLVRGLALSFLAAIFEEVVFRGFLFRLTAQLAGTWGALLFTSLLFGAAHAFNPNATVLSSLAIALEAGILLGGAFAATGRLWMPIGLHAGWNFAEGSLFSMSVSGDAAEPAGLIHGRLSGPTILTGGSFGPEASVIAVIVCLAASSLFLRRMIRTDAIEKPLWKHAETTAKR